MSANGFVSNDVPLVSRDEARASGRKRFFTGLPCKKAHIAERYTAGGQCCACQIEAFRSYRSSHREQERKRRRSYYTATKDKQQQRYSANREAIKTSRKEARDKNIEVARAAQSARRSAKLDQYRASDLLYRQAHREVIRSRQNEWERQHPEVRKARKHRRRARVSGAEGVFSADDVLRIFRQQSGRCAMCKIKLGKRYEVDHINPLARGGRNDNRNLQVLCKSCNASKGARDPIDYARGIGRLL